MRAGVLPRQSQRMWRRAQPLARHKPAAAAQVLVCAAHWRWLGQV